MNWFFACFCLLSISNQKWTPKTKTPIPTRGSSWLPAETLPVAAIHSALFAARRVMWYTEQKYTNLQYLTMQKMSIPHKGQNLGLKFCIQCSESRSLEWKPLYFHLYECLKFGNTFYASYKVNHIGWVRELDSMSLVKPSVSKIWQFGIVSQIK